MAHVVAGAKPRLARRRALARRLGRAAGPGRRESRERGVASRLLALFVARASDVPVEIRPLVALLGLDRAAMLDALRRQLAEEPRRRILVRAPEQGAMA